MVALPLSTPALLPLMADPLGMHCLQAKIQEVAACLTAVADSLSASGQAAVQPVNPIVSALHGQGTFRLPDTHCCHAPCYMACLK